MSGRRLVLIGTLAGVLAAGSVTAAIAAFEVLPLPPRLVQVEGDVSPELLPEDEQAPVTARAWGGVKTSDGTHPPALRRVTFAIDRNIDLGAEGLPVCGFRLITTPDSDEAKRRCRRSIIGSGEAQVQFAYPENVPIPIAGSLAVFNGGVSRGVTTLLVRGATPIPTPRAIVAKVEIWKRQDGRYGRMGRVSVPAIGEGYGSLLSFDLSIGRRFVSDGKRMSYFTAKCPADGLRLRLLRATLQEPPGGSTFTLEGGAPGFEASLTIPCTPKG